jgi:hypothetical protein
VAIFPGPCSRRSRDRTQGRGHQRGPLTSVSAAPHPPSPAADAHFRSPTRREMRGVRGLSGAGRHQRTPLCETGHRALGRRARALDCAHERGRRRGGGPDRRLRSGVPPAVVIRRRADRHRVRRHRAPGGGGAAASRTVADRPPRPHPRGRCLPERALLRGGRESGRSWFRPAVPLLAHRRRVGPHPRQLLVAPQGAAGRARGARRRRTAHRGRRGGDRPATVRGARRAGLRGGRGDGGGPAVRRLEASSAGAGRGRGAPRRLRHGRQRVTSPRPAAATGTRPHPRHRRACLHAPARRPRSRRAPGRCTAATCNLALLPTPCSASAAARST